VGVGDIQAQARAFRIVAEGFGEHARAIEALTDSATSGYGKVVDGVRQGLVTTIDLPSKRAGRPHAYHHHVGEIDVSAANGATHAEWSALGQALDGVDELVAGSRKMVPGNDLQLGRFMTAAESRSDVLRQHVARFGPEEIRRAPSGVHRAATDSDDAGEHYLRLREQPKDRKFFKTTLTVGEHRPIRTAVDELLSTLRRASDAGTSTERPDALARARVEATEPRALATGLRQDLEAIATDAIRPGADGTLVVDRARMQDLAAAALTRGRAGWEATPDDPLRRALDDALRSVAGIDAQLDVLYARGSSSVMRLDRAQSRALTRALGHEIDPTERGWVGRRVPRAPVEVEEELATLGRRLASVADPIDAYAAPTRALPDAHDILARARAAGAAPDTGAIDIA
jgi:hypothetical protein